jgi:cyclophilin family peptidyl-prolyl cis-trans isomerase
MLSTVCALLSSQLRVGAADTTMTIQTKPTTFYVEFQVHNLMGASPNKGLFGIEVFPEWAPHSAKHFKLMVQENLFDRSHIHRVVPGVGCLFGIPGNPHSAKRHKSTAIEPDSVQVSNAEGMVSFAAFSTTGDNKGESVPQLWVNFVDNPQLDSQGYAPFGKVIKGFDLLVRSSTAYGPGADSPDIPLPLIAAHPAGQTAVYSSGNDAAGNEKGSAVSVTPFVVDGKSNCNSQAGAQKCDGPTLPVLHDDEFNLIDYKFPKLSWIMAADFIQHTAHGHAVTVGVPHIDWDHEQIQKWHDRLKEKRMREEL